MTKLSTQEGNIRQKRKTAGTVAPPSNVREPGLDRVVDGALWLAWMACFGATLYFSFWADPFGGAFHGADKVGHAVAYFATTISFLLVAVWRPGRGLGRWPQAGVWFPVAAVIAGIAVEIMQATLTATRTAEVGDVVAEVVGSGLAFIVHALTRWSFATRTSAHAPRP
jgi:hypothetical protein